MVPLFPIFPVLFAHCSLPLISDGDLLLPERISAMADERPPSHTRSSLPAFFPVVDLVVSTLVAPSSSSVSL
jgi:hypothetical protein